MGTARRDMYKFVWDEGEDPDTHQSGHTSPKDIVANILRETELPELQLESRQNSKGLSTEQELFSIDDDDDYDFEETFNISSRVRQKEVPKTMTASGPNKDLPTRHRGGEGRRQEPVRVSYNTQEPDRFSKGYEKKAPAKVPPQVSVQHPRLSHLEEGAVTNSFNTYLEQTARDNNNEESGSKVKTGHSETALLPTDTLEMDLDDVDSGVADTEHDTHTDTQPIVTLDQGKLAARWRTRRQKINFLVALGLVILGVVVLTVALILIIRMVRS